MWGTLVFPGAPCHLMIFSTRDFGREFLYPQMLDILNSCDRDPQQEISKAWNSSKISWRLLLGK